MKNILSLKYNEARDFLLKNESYINIDLPPYINFEDLLLKISKKLKGEVYKSIKNKNPDKLENINYKLLHNKNGKYEWRPFELIHPVLYVSLVNQITTYKNWKLIKKRFGTIRGKSVVKCMSMPIVSETEKSDKAEQITNWWESVEQKSLELSLDYEYIYHTDISNCYSSIYTHSIPWALHTKKIAKKEKFSDQLIGNSIDEHIRSMSYGQTNGIPQGSVVMDFIAEMVLSYADLLVSEEISKDINSDKFEILRYRDDYRIFVNNPMIADNIIKKLTEVLMGLGLKLHSQKTVNFNNVIRGSIKADKIDWLMSKRESTTVQKQLLVLHKFSNNNKNSGVLTKELQAIFSRINQNTKSKKKKKIFKKIENIHVLISIVTDIAYHNPRTYSISAAILSKLFSLIDSEAEALEIIKRVLGKISKIPNTGHMQIWMQRAVIKNKNIESTMFSESICKLVSGKDIVIWNHEWLPKKEYIDEIFNKINLVNSDVINDIDAVIDEEEVLLFGSHSL